MTFAQLLKQRYGSIDTAEEKVFLELEKTFSHNHQKFVELRNKYPKQFAKFARIILDLSYWVSKNT